ncbi:hypothetical protein A9Q91_01690 [Candidatus Gracilibacteria bacterium 28_42_T64]|nr:hypothetical protein A9Q91_01690 [Candidatus Gracilibacteria bacterium 28_42_T64]
MIQKIKTVTIALLLTGFFIFNGINSSYSYHSENNIGEFKQELQAIKNGELLVNKIDKIVTKVVKKSKMNKAFGLKLKDKIITIKNKLSKKSDSKSKKYVVILNYLHAKLEGELEGKSPRVMKRIISHNNKSKAKVAKDRVKKIKSKNVLDRYKGRKKR